jgi:hypothetical protein
MNIVEISLIGLFHNILQNPAHIQKQNFYLLDNRHSQKQIFFPLNIRIVLGEILALVQILVIFLVVPELYTIFFFVLYNRVKIRPEPPILIQNFQKILHEPLSSILETQFHLMFKINLDVLAQIPPAVDLNLQRVQNWGRNPDFIQTFTLVGSLMIFQTSFITVKRRVALLAVELDIHVRAAERTRHHNVWLLLLGQI